ncbi:MAG: DUF1343 domain-containing protein [bacterium]
MTVNPVVRTGLERLLDDAHHLIRGRRVGLLCNPVSVDRALRHAADLLHTDRGCDLVRLLGPEHGVRGVAQDMIAVDKSRDPHTGVEVVSLYGSAPDTLRPKRSHLQGLDVLVCDLQDIGSRYYTYVWTVLYCLETASEIGLPVVVCDRPNPLGGLAVEGGDVRPGFESFVGLYSVPNRHGMTLGELARFAHKERNLDCPLEIVELRGWKRRFTFEQCGLPWVMPSPNMPTLDTAFVYPGLCLIEGTELSEGRGTTRPFELVGAPYIDPYRLASTLDELALPGVRFRPAWFRPQFQKHAGRDCGGVQVHVTHRETFRPYLTGVAIVATVRRLYPDKLEWRTRAYEFVDDVPAFDLLAGNAELRQRIEAGAPLDALQSTWQAEEDAFRAARTAHLLYD